MCAFLNKIGEKDKKKKRKEKKKISYLLYKIRKKYLLRKLRKLARELGKNRNLSKKRGKKTQLEMLQITFNLRLILSISLGLTALSGIAGNTVSIICIRRQMKVPNGVRNSFKILLSLALVDLLVTGITCPLVACRLMIFDLPPLYQLISRYINASLNAGSSLTVILLTVERYIKITHSNNYDNIMDDNKLNVWIMASWIISFAVSISSFYQMKVFGFLNGIITVITITTLPILYLYIYRFYQRSKRAVEASGGDNDRHNSKHDHEKKKQKMIVRKILLVVGIYYIFTISYGVATIVRPLISDRIFFIILTLNYVKSTVNPIVYVLRDDQFSRYAKQIFRCHKKVNIDHSLQVTGCGTTSENIDLSSVIRENTFY